MSTPNGQLIKSSWAYNSYGRINFFLLRRSISEPRIVEWAWQTFWLSDAPTIVSNNKTLTDQIGSVAAAGGKYIIGG